MTRGHCSACLQPAEQAPSGRWWHLGPSCRQYIIRPAMSAVPVPRFVEDA